MCIFCVILSFYDHQQNQHVQSLLLVYDFFFNSCIKPCKSSNSVYGDCVCHLCEKIVQNLLSMNIEIKFCQSILSWLRIQSMYIIWFLLLVQWCIGIQTFAKFYFLSFLLFKKPKSSKYSMNKTKSNQYTVWFLTYMYVFLTCT